jgi:hypothetical protein
MTEKVFKVATYQEIVDYYNDKAKEVKSYPLFSNEESRIKRQLDDHIMSGSPLVTITLPSLHPLAEFKDHQRQQFIMSDYSTRRLDMEMARLDDQTLRQDKMEKIKWILQMDLDAEERWERILKVVEEFEGVSIPLTA